MKNRKSDLHRRVISALEQGQRCTQSDYELLKQHYKFIIPDDEDDNDDRAARMVRHYHQYLFKEFALADIRSARQVGLRWRTAKEVAEGIGQFTCANLRCLATAPDEDDNNFLADFELDFCYQENGAAKQALVKVRLCPNCSQLLQK